MRYKNNNYQDRGMKKWAGFYLSEHTAEQEKNTQEAAHINKAKEEMSETEIKAVLEEAVLKNKRVSVQLRAVNYEGNYYDDVVGFLKGADALGIFVGMKKIPYADMRHIEINQQIKWSSID